MLSRFGRLVEEKHLWNSLQRKRCKTWKKLGQMSYKSNERIPFDLWRKYPCCEFCFCQKHSYWFHQRPIKILGFAATNITHLTPVCNLTVIDSTLRSEVIRLMVVNVETSLRLRSTELLNWHDQNFVRQVLTIIQTFVMKRMYVRSMKNCFAQIVLLNLLVFLCLQPNKFNCFSLKYVQ